MPIKQAYHLFDSIIIPTSIFSSSSLISSFQPAETLIFTLFQNQITYLRLTKLIPHHFPALFDQFFLIQSHFKVRSTKSLKSTMCRNNNNLLMQQYSGKFDARRSQQDKQQPSRVLLVCIYDTIALEVTNQLVYEKFSRYGSIIKVLIFEKGEVTKLFVEYAAQDSAEQAKKALDGTKLLGAICKMNIYFSNFTNVDLKNETSQGADFTLVEEMKNDYVRRFDQMSRSYQSEEQELFNQDFILDSAFTPFVSRSKTDNPRRLQDEIQRISVMPYQQQPMHVPMINQEEEFEHMIHHGINNILENHSSHSAEHKPVSTYNSSVVSLNSIERISPTLKIKQAESSSNSVLRFELKKDIKIKYIYNLFSNFGNLSFISKKNNRVYIKFRTLQFAAIAKTYLNERFLMGNLLILTCAENPEEGLPQEGEFCECIFYDKSYDRFTPHRSLTVNSPSNTLHVSSLKKDTCKEHVLFKIFGEYGRVEAVKILCYSNEKNMALVKFYSMEDSFEAIASLHNEVFSGRKMQISFTKSRV